MKNFVFRLEALLDVKKRKEEEVKLLLAEVNRQAEQVRAEINRIQGMLKEFQVSEKLNRKAGESIASMRSSVAYRHSLKLDLLREGRKLDEILQETHKIHQELVVASQERRAVEIIKEKRYADWKRKNSILEQGFIDEISQQGYIRARAAEADRRN